MTTWNAGKALGPNLPQELSAAGALGLPFAWGADGQFTFGPTMTAAQIDAVKAVVAAHSALTPDSAPKPMAIQQSLGGIFAGTDAQRVRRMVDVIDRKPSLGIAMLLLTLPPPPPPARAGLIRQVTADVKALIGTPSEILTQAEYDALTALAASQGLPDLVAGASKSVGAP